MADITVNTPFDEYRRVEDGHMVFDHLFIDYLRRKVDESLSAF